MKILIAGLGSIGRRHLRNLLALGEHDIVLYRTHHSTLPDEDLEGFPVETKLHSALAQQPDAVVISNPTALHLSVAIPAAEAGCHLLLEKPVSHSLDGIHDLQAALKRGGGQVLVGYQFRFHPGLQLISGLLSEGAIGRPISVRAHWGEYLPGWHPWEDYRQGYSARRDLGGGVILTLSHVLDYLGWIFGEARSVWAFAGPYGFRDLEVEDTAEIGLQFESGVLGSVHLDYNQRPPAHTLEVIGTSGTLRWDNADGSVHVYDASQPDPCWQSYPVVANAGQVNNINRNDLFMAEMEHFLAVARAKVQPLCTLEDGIQALRLSVAAIEASQQRSLQTLSGG